MKPCLASTASKDMGRYQWLRVFLNTPGMDGVQGGSRRVTAAIFFGRGGSGESTSLTRHFFVAPENLGHVLSPQINSERRRN